jgi:hypothetical protein
VTTIGAKVTKPSSNSISSSDKDADGAHDASGPESTENADNTAALLKVVRGQPTAEELAALVAVVASRVAGATEAPAAAPKVSGWTDRSRSLRVPGTPAPGGWRASGFPR